MAAQKMALVVDGVAVNVCPSKAALEESFHPDIAAQFVEVPNEVAVGWRFVDDEWLEPLAVPEPPPAPEPPAPSEYYLPKVTFERRLPDMARLRIEALRNRLKGYGEDWLDDEVATDQQKADRNFVLGMRTYDAAENINVLDADVPTLLGGLQAVYGLFGTPIEAAAAIERATTPGRLDGEPVT